MGKGLITCILLYVALSFYGSLVRQFSLIEMKTPNKIKSETIMHRQRQVLVIVVKVLD